MAIFVTITPSAASGIVVSGNLYADDAVDHLPISGSESADELAAFPYEYTVGE